MKARAQVVELKASSNDRVSCSRRIDTPYYAGRPVGKRGTPSGSANEVDTVSKEVDTVSKIQF